MLLTKCTQFIETFAKLSDDKYLDIKNDKYQIIDCKSKEFKTNQIIEIINQFLKSIEKCQNEPISNKIRLLKKLDSAVDSYNQRISKWISSRWWYCIAKCFGYPQCPKKLLNVKAAVGKELKSQNNLHQYELKVQVVKKLKEIIDHKNTLIRKVRFQWKFYILFCKDSIELNRSLKIAEKKARIEKEQEQLKKQKIQELKNRWNDVMAKRKFSEKTLTEDSILKINAWDKIKQNSDLSTEVCSFLSNNDLSSLSKVGKKERDITRKEFELRKRAKDLFLTRDEIEIGNICGNSFLERLIFEARNSIDFTIFELIEILDEEVVKKSNTIKDLIKEVLKYWSATEEEIQIAIESENSLYELILKKWGFTDKEITLASQSKNGLKKLVREAKEAERLIKFCRFLPKNLLNEIVKQHLPHLNPELKPRIINFNFLEKIHTTKSNDDFRPIILDIPIIGGNDLLKVANEIQNFMKSEEGQKIEQLKIKWHSFTTWKIETAIQLDSLPISINMLKGLKHLEILDYDTSKRRLKQLPPLCLPNLNKLTVISTNIAELPYMDLPELTDCELYNSFRKIPHFNGNLPKLLNLELNGGDYFIKSWQDVELPISLRSLTIKNSKIRHLPTSIGKLKNLTELNISQSNKKPASYVLKDLEIIKQEIIEKYKHSIDKIPPEIALLENLKILRLINCNINQNTEGFEWVSLLPNLKQFEYRDSDY